MPCAYMVNVPFTAAGTLLQDNGEGLPDDFVSSKYDPEDWPDASFSVGVPNAALPDVFPFIGTIVASAELVAELDDTIVRYLRLLPALVMGKRYWVLSPLLIVDALENFRTTWEVDEETGKKCRIIKYVFRRRAVPKGQFFRIPEENSYQMFYGRNPSNDPIFSLSSFRAASVLGLSEIECR